MTCKSSHSWHSLRSTSVGANAIPPRSPVAIDDAAGSALDGHALTAKLEQIVILVAVGPRRLAFESDGSSILYGREVERRVGRDGEVLDENRRARADDGLDGRSIVCADRASWVGRSRQSLRAKSIGR